MKWALLGTWGFLVLSLMFSSAMPGDPATLWKGVSAWVLGSMAEMDPFSWCGLGNVGLWGLKAGFVLLGLAAAAWIQGSPLNFWLKGRRESGAILGLGLAMAACGIQSLGLLGLWFKPIFVGIMLLLALTGWRFFLYVPRPRLGRLREWPLPAWLFLGLFVFMIGLSRIPTNAEDPFLYHWAAIEHYLNFHKILGAPYCMAWNFPLFVEMVYAPALAFLGEDGARLVNILFLALIALALLELSRKWGDSRARWWGVWIFVGSFNVANTILNGKNDLGAVLFAMLALGAIMRGFNGGPAAAWLAGGIFGGALVVAKLIDAGILVGMAVAVLYMGKGIPWRRIGLACLGGMAVALPWYLQLWFLSGNPVVPLALPIFNNPWWGLEEAKGTLQGFKVWADPNLLLPTGTLAGFWGMCKSGVALALLAPLALMGRNLCRPEASRRERVFLLITLLVAYAAWAVSPRRAVRYLFPLEPLIALLAIPQLMSPTRNLRRALALVSILQLAGIGIFVRPVFEYDGALPFLLGQVDRQEITGRLFTSKLEVKNWINKNLRRTDGIWLTGEDRRFGFVPKVISQFYVDKRLVWVWAQECYTAEEMAKKAKQWGVTHILLNPLSAVYRSAMWYQGREWSDRMIEVYGDFFRRYARPVYRSPWYDYLSGQYHLFSLDGDPETRREFIWFLPGTEGVISPLNAPWLGGKRPTPQEYIGWTLYVTGRLGNVGSALENQADGLIRVGEIQKATQIMDRIYGAGYEGDGTASDYSRLLLLSSERFDEAIKAAAKGARSFPGNDRLLTLGQAVLAKGIFLARKGRLAQAGKLADRAAIIARICSDSQGVENVYYGVSGIKARLGHYSEARRYINLAWSRGMRGKEIEALRDYLGSPRRH